MSVAQATVIAHSISNQGIPLITFQLRYWRPIHAECRTHRVLSQSSEQIVVLEQEISLMDDRDMSRNAGSSRARPSKAIIEQVKTVPWMPLHWGKNQPGMQAHEEQDLPVSFPSFMQAPLREFLGLSPEEQAPLELSPQDAWRFAAWLAAVSAEAFDKVQYHKQLVNRMIEPYTYIDVVVTGTDFANWFALRDHPDADPGIQNLAQAMKEALAASKPTRLNPGQWHLPYITPDDEVLVRESMAEDKGYSGLNHLMLLRKISAARCARVSYKAFDGTVSPIAADLDLFDKLVRAELVHASPTEHQATPDFWDGANEEWLNPELHGNLRGWIQNRKLIPNEYVAG